MNEKTVGAISSPIATLVLVALLVVGAIAFLGETHANEQLISGLEKGFELRGTFAYDSSLERSMYFEAGEGQERITWAGRTESSDYATGIVSETGDPNVYLLITDGDDEYALVHIAYSNSRDGELYVSYDGTNFESFQKISDSRISYTA